MRYDFLIETYATEQIKILSVWSEFRDDELEVRPNAVDARGGAKAPLPQPCGKPVRERPAAGGKA